MKDIMVIYILDIEFIEIPVVCGVVDFCDAVAIASLSLVSSKCLAV